MDDVSAPAVVDALEDGLGDLRLELLVKRNPIFTSVMSTDPHVLVVRSQRAGHAGSARLRKT